MSESRARWERIQRASLLDETRLLSASAPGSWLYEDGSIFASVVPAAPDQPIANTVTYSSPATVVPSLVALTDVYRSARVDQWRVWAPEWHGEVAAALKRTGYVRTARLPAIVFDLVASEPPAIGDLDYDADCDMPTLGYVNQVAHASGTGLAAALVLRPQNLGVRIYRARVAGETAAVVAAMDHEGPEGPDCGVYFGATLPRFRRRGFGTRLVSAAITEARERGCITASGQASLMGAPVWAAMGFRTVFHFDTYEPKKQDGWTQP